jgi:hypothetical protein
MDLYHQEQKSLKVLYHGFSFTYCSPILKRHHFIFECLIPRYINIGFVLLGGIFFGQVGKIVEDFIDTFDAAAVSV